MSEALIFHQLTHYMTTDCSWNYHENYKCRTWAEHVLPNLLWFPNSKKNIFCENYKKIHILHVSFYKTHNFTVFEMGLVAMRKLFLCEFYFSKLSHILLLHVFRDSGKIDGSVISCQIQHQTVIRYEVISNQLYLCKFRPGPFFLLAV